MTNVYSPGDIDSLGPTSELIGEATSSPIEFIRARPNSNDDSGRVTVAVISIEIRLPNGIAQGPMRSGVVRRHWRKRAPPIFHVDRFRDMRSQTSDSLP